MNDDMRCKLVEIKKKIKKSFRVLYFYAVNEVFSGICLKQTELIDCTLDNIQKIVIQIVYLI